MVKGKIKHLTSKGSQQSSPQSSKSNLHSTSPHNEGFTYSIDQLTDMFMNQAQTELQLVTEKDVPYYLQANTSLEAIRRKSKRLPTFDLPEPTRSFADRGFDPDEFIRRQVLREGQTELEESDIAKLHPSVRKFLEAKGKEKEEIIEGIYQKMPTLKKEQLDQVD
uniref:Uncharacterized protein n=1 Tax=Strombidium inclinatum TaxID=197538 RepID=A0A7S3IIF7_9SPIT|mmetsp:Transcript_18175/g.27972  ORF Transcript_18175/g.27972 Transcript_18175/m.27972 type:complete len:165 (+) Transcript_18175:1634-2128(+)